MRRRLGGSTSSGRQATCACASGVTNDISTASRDHCAASRPPMCRRPPASICRAKRSASLQPAIAFRGIGARAHHRQVAGRVPGAVEHAIDRRIARLAGCVRQHFARDRADRHVDLRQVVRRDLHAFERAAALPGVQPQAAATCAHAASRATCASRRRIGRLASPGAPDGLRAGARPAARRGSGHGPSRSRSRWRRRRVSSLRAGGASSNNGAVCTWRALFRADAPGRPRRRQSPQPTGSGREPDESASIRREPDIACRLTP